MSLGRQLSINLSTVITLTPAFNYIDFRQIAPPASPLPQNLRMYQSNNDGRIHFKNAFGGEGEMTLGNLITPTIFNPSTNIEINLNSGTLINGLPTLDWINCILYTPSGIERADWQSTYLFDATSTLSVYWDVRQLLDVGATTALDWRIRVLNNSSNTTILDWENQFAYDAFSSLSINWALRQLLDNAGHLSVDWLNHQLGDASLTLAGDWDARVLYDQTGTASVNWKGKQLSHTGIPTVDWQNNQLTANSTGLSVDWGTRDLYFGGNPTANWSLLRLYSATKTVVDWSLQQLNDSSATLSEDWNLRRLIGSNGTTIALDWSVGYCIISGTTTNNSAAAGKIGEVARANVVQGSAVALVTATTKTITSISLTAGDWDVSGVICLTGTLTGTQFIGAIGSTTNALTGTVLGDSQIATPTLSAATSDMCLTIPSFRVSLSATTTYYLLSQATFTVGSASAYGRISARRAR